MPVSERTIGPLGGEKTYGTIERLERPALWLLVLVFAATIVFWLLDIKVSSDPPYLIFSLNILFIGIPACFIAVITARGFLRTGVWSVLWLGIGAVAFALATLEGSFLLGRASANTVITVHNLIAFFSASLYFVGAFFAFNRVTILDGKPERLSAILQVYLGSLAFIVFVTLLSVQELLPPFFIEEQGGTPLRQMLVGTAALLFLVAGLGILRQYLRAKFQLLYWYSLGLLLMSLGMGGTLMETSMGTPLNWMGRGAQLLGGVYLLMAALVVLKEARAKKVSAAEVIAAFFRKTKDNYQRLATNTGDAAIPSDGDSAVSRWSLSSISKWLGLAPLIIIIILIVGLAISGARVSSAPPTLFPILNTLFIFTTYSVAAYYCARSFLRTGLWQVLLFGTGVLVLGVSATMAAWLSIRGGLNTITKVHNISALIASLLILFVVILIWKGASPRKETGRLRAVMTVYAAGLAFIALIAILAVGDRLIPTFFDASGHTLLRQAIFGTAALLLGISTVWMALTHFKSGSVFVYWCCLGIALITIGFTTGLLIDVLSDEMSWLSRITLYFSGIYLIVGGLVARAEARTRGVQLQELIAEFGKQAKVNYELLVNFASDAIIAVDGLGRILLWNPAAEKMFGYSRSEAVGSALFDLITDPGQVDSYKKAAGAVGPERDEYGASVTVELKARRRNGEEFPVELTLVSRRLAAGGAPYCCCCYYAGDKGYHRAQAGGGGAARERRALPRCFSTRGDRHHDS